MVVVVVVVVVARVADEKSLAYGTRAPPRDFCFSTALAVVVADLYHIFEVS